MDCSRTVSLSTIDMPNEKSTPFNLDKIEEISSIFPTPFYVYDAAGIKATARRMYGAFDRVMGFCNFYAVKALPNPEILSLLIEEGMGLDCSSLAELCICEKMGILGEKIMFSSNNTPANEYEKAIELGALINLDDITQIDLLVEVANMTDFISFRFNPGLERTGNAIIGNPVEAKFGLTREQLYEAYKVSSDLGAKRFGLHTMLASNELEKSYFLETGRMLCDLVVDIKSKLGISIELVDLGGGIGIPYKPEEEEVDIEWIGREIAKLVNSYNFEKTPSIVMECGRYVTGPHGYLVTSVRHTKSTYKKYIGVDATMADLMRPGMYGAYHHISVLGKQDFPANHCFDVVGSLCENNDKFAIDRALPEINIGDFLVIHDSGAHGRAMGFNYNGKLRAAEILLKEDGSFKCIRRAETLEDYFATLDIKG